MKDLMGKEIKVGDFVAYAGRHSSSLWVNIGKVLKVAASRITVRGSELNWADKWGVLTRNSTLTIWSRIVVVEPTEYHRELLKDFNPEQEIPCTSVTSPLQEQSL